MARLLHDFNTEYHGPVPEVGLLTGASRGSSSATRRPSCSSAPVPTAWRVRFRPSLITGELDAYLEELYVAPAVRGRGSAGCSWRGRWTRRASAARRMDLGTSEDDDAARALYESAGFTNRERPPTGR